LVFAEAFARQHDSLVVQGDDGVEVGEERSWYVPETEAGGTAGSVSVLYLGIG